MGFLGPFHSSGFLSSFSSFLHLSLPLVFAKSFGLPGPITTSLPFGFIGFYANLMNLLIPFLGFPDPFYFFSIFYNSHGFTTLFLKLPWLICFLSGNLLFLWACWLLFPPFWPDDLCFTIFSPHLFHFVGFLLPLGPLVKSGH